MLALLASCNKNESVYEPNAARPVSDKACQVNVSINGFSTKAGANALDEEEKVNSLQIFLFKDGQLDGYGQAAASTVTLKATAGEREVYAIVNAPDLSAVKTMDELKSSISLLEHNSASGFVMVGNKSVSIVDATAVTVDVKRIAARVVVRKITRKYDAAGLQSAGVPVEVKRLYMTEVATNNKYDLSMVSGYTYKASLVSGASSALETADPFLYHAVSGGSIAAHEESYVLVDESKREGVFYVYPNATTEDSESDRITRLNIEVEVDGQLYNYPVLISGIQSNKSYEIKELVLTRLGNTADGDDTVNAGEDSKIESFEVPFGIAITDWEVQLLGEDGVVTI